MPEHHRPGDDDPDREPVLERLARYDAERDQIAVGSPENGRTYDIRFARRLRDALTAAIREAEGERWDRIWADDMWYPDSGRDGNRHRD